MRLRGMLVLGALTIGAMACGDALAPPASEGRDLEFMLPAAKGEVPTSTRYRTWDEKVSESDIAKVGGRPEASLTYYAPDDGGGRLAPLLYSRYAAGEFVEDDYRIQYGMFGFGSGYTMTPQVKVYGPSGNVILNESGRGRTEDAPIVFYMRPHVEESFRLNTSCGAMAELKVLFEVRVGLPGFPIVREQGGEFRTDYQRQCPPPTTPQNGGISTQTTYDGLYVCYYEVWVDGYGNIVEVYFIGCQQLSGPILLV